MRACDDIADFVSAPVGRCVVRPSYVVWCAAPDLQGATLWGRIHEEPLRELLTAGQHQLHRSLTAPRRLLVDCRHVTEVDVDATVAFGALARDRVARWERTVDRQAVIVPPGLPGVLVAGALASLGVVHPIRFVHEAELALDYLDHPEAGSAHAIVTRLAQAHQTDTTLRARLHAHLGTDPRTATVASAAAALGMSTRTLQRELARMNTSFSDELRHVRVAAAESLLVHSELKIDAIAARLGFGNASRMSAILRRDRNATATAIRARGAARVPGQAAPRARDPRT